MPEARDRRVTALDIATIYVRRRASIFELDPLPIGSVPAEAAIGSGRFGLQRHSVGRGRLRARALPAPGPENTPIGTVRRGRGRGSSSRSVLPSWYPRTPLRDVSAVVQAIERRRGRLGNDELQQTGTPIYVDQLLSDPPSSSSSSSVSRRRRAFEISPGIKIRTPYGSKVPKILLDVNNLSEEGDSEFLTPEKKLLNSIDKVEKVVTQELQKLKRTPSAKKAEREKRVRTLMSMR